MIFWHKHRKSVQHDKKESQEVAEMNKRTHRTAEQTDKDIRRLNKLLSKDDGITLKINIASGRHHA